MEAVPGIWDQGEAQGILCVLGRDEFDTTLELFAVATGVRFDRAAPPGAPASPHVKRAARRDTALALEAAARASPTIGGLLADDVELYAAARALFARQVAVLRRDQGVRK